MIQFVIAAGLLGFVVYMLLPEHRRRQWGRKALIWGGVAFLVLMLVTGRLHWLFAVGAALLPMAQRLLPLIRAWPLVRRWLGGRGAETTDAGDGDLRGRLLTLSLGNGQDMDGMVHAGRWKGRRLSDLSLPELRQLNGYCEKRDPASAALLRAYMDRRHGDEWRTAANTGSEPMTREEACAILAVPADADASTITAAHRRLMQRLHPDRGGSDYLASRINAAKKRLLEP